MTKLTLSDVTNFTNESSAVATINANSASIETALDNTLSRDGTSPNQMGATLDMNSHRIINLPAPQASSDAARKLDIENVLSGTYSGQTILGTTAEITAVTVGATSTLSLPVSLSFTGKTVTGGTYVGGTITGATISGSNISGGGTIQGLTITTTTGTLTIPNGVTLTGPAASGTVMATNSADTVTGVKTFGSAGAVGKFVLAGSTSGSTVVNAGAVAGSTTITLPAVTDTLVSKTSTDTLTNKTFDTSGTGNVLQIGSATVTRGQIPGETTTGSAAAGYVGEYVESRVAQASAISMTSATPINVTSISLTAGDWDVSATTHFTGGATTTISHLLGSISTVTGTLSTTEGRSGIWVAAFSSSTPFNFGQSASNNVIVAIPPVRFSLSSTTTIYLVAEAPFGVSTCTAFGVLRARRVR